MPVYLGPMIGFDVAGYSLRSFSEQEKIQALVQDVASRAVRDAGADVLFDRWLNRGDGGFILLLGEVKLGPRLVELMCARLRIHNSPPGAVGLNARYALHFGMFQEKLEHLDAAHSGPDIDTLAFILSNMSHDIPDQVVISDQYRVLLEESGNPSYCFQEIPDLTDKHGRVRKVWNFHSSGCGKRLP